MFGDSCGFHRYKTHYSTGERKCSTGSVSVSLLKRSSDSVENCSTDWEFMLLCSSSSVSPLKGKNYGIFNAGKL